MDVLAKIVQEAGATIYQQSTTKNPEAQRTEEKPNPSNSKGPTEQKVYDAEYKVEEDK